MSQAKYLTINGTNYTIANLAEAAKTQVSNIQIVDVEIARLQQQLAIAQTARNAYSQALLAELKNKEEPAEKPKKPRAPAKKKVAVKATAVQ